MIINIMSRKTKNRVKSAIFNFKAASSFLICVLVGAAIFQLNSHIHQNSLINDLEREIVAIAEENSVLEARLSQLNSMDDFDRYRVAQAENYEKVDLASVRYIQVPAGGFAKK